MASNLRERVRRLEASEPGSIDIAATLSDLLRRARAGEPLPPSQPITGNSKLAIALRAARRRVGCY